MSSVARPENMKEVLIMSVPNAVTMVLGMVALNLWIYGALTFGHFARTVPLMFVTAFSLDFILAGPVSIYVVRRIGNYKYMPLIRVAIMAGILTFVAPIIEGGHVISLGQYLRAVPRNYIAALILQVFIALRIGVYVFGRYKLRHAAN